MRIKKALFLGTLCTAVSGMSLFAQAGVSYAKSAKEATEEISSEEATEVESEEETSEEVTYPITVEHAFGETVIESKPERIATIGWENQDTPLALGVAPVGVSAANYGLVTDNNLHLWTDEAFADLGVEKPVVFDDVDGLDFEQISDCNPDVILAAYSGMTQEDYDTLSQIAPVIPYKEKAWQTSWREQTIENAEGMGMKPEGEKKVKEVEDLIAEKLEEYPQLEGIPTAFCWISADDFSTFYVYLPTDPRAAYLLDLGFTLPESVQKLVGETDDFNITVSRENADQLDDIQLMVVYGDEDLLKSLQEDKLMSQIPAIKNGAVALVDSTSALAGACTPSILSIPYEIDEYLQLLSDAAENIK